MEPELTHIPTPAASVDGFSLPLPCLAGAWCQCRKVGAGGTHAVEWGMVAAILTPAWRHHGAPGGRPTLAES